MTSRTVVTTCALLLLALVLGVVVAFGQQLIFAAALGRAVHVETDVLIMNAVLVSIPFLFLSFKPRLLPWLIALAATVAVNGWWMSQGIAYQRAPDGTGVPILGAVAMLFAPFVILLVTGILNWTMPRRQKAGGSRR